MFNCSMRHTSLIKNIERSQRLDRFLQDKDIRVLNPHNDMAEDRILSTDDREKALENFMDSVTDKAVIEDAKVAWPNKTCYMI